MPHWTPDLETEALPTREKHRNEGKPWEFLPKIKGDGWGNVMKEIDKYDDEVAKGWRDDIDTLLVFAGLFSAVVTAFVIESYQWFSEDPGEKTARLIAQLSQHIGTPNISFQDQQPFSVDPRTIRINTFWFLSLMLALSTASAAILAKQWLREYRRDPPGKSNQESFNHRQLRLQSWECWKVPEIISLLPILLEIALVFFFMGVIDLLWSLNWVVASAVTIVVALTVLFLIATTMLPAWYMCSQFHHDEIRRGRRWEIAWNDLNPCPYKSPQSLFFTRLANLCLLSLLKLPDTLDMSSWPSFDAWVIKDSNPEHQDARAKWPADSYVHRGMRWVVLNLGDTLPMVYNILYCINSTPEEENLIQYATDQPNTTSRDLATWTFVNPFRGTEWRISSWILLDPRVGSA
ncbi:hypothetical protein C8J56DRAFT_128177 [Mycena floridula]|nr:hypothetical protein C8J56DRAFT_128177 [Mycena floridula]